MLEKRYLIAGLGVQAVGGLGVILGWPGHARGPLAHSGAALPVFVAGIALVWVGVLCGFVWAVAVGVRFGLHGTVSTLRMPKRRAVAQPRRRVSPRKAT